MDQTDAAPEVTNTLEELPDTEKGRMQMPSVAISMTRKQLYDELWTISAAAAAKKYEIPYAQFLARVKKAGIPIPPSGHWTKIQFGKATERPDLDGDPEALVSFDRKKNHLSNVRHGNAGVSQQPKKQVATPTQPVPKPAEQETLPERKEETEETSKQVEVAPRAAVLAGTNDVLQFLPEEERAAVLSAVSQMVMPGEHERMHASIIANRKRAAEWRALYKERADWDPRVRTRNMPPAPLLAKNISEEAVPRVGHIIDALIKTIKPLGCALNDDLQFEVNGELVTLSFSESQDTVPHVLTKKENRALVEYEEKRRKNKYASKPNIRKYDHVYNGKLSLAIQGRKTYRDCASYRLENRLGDVVLDLYLAAEKLKQKRLEQEELERQREEKRNQERIQRERVKQEMDRTLSLENMAEDYEVASRIRRFVAAYVNAHPDEDTAAFQRWALKKADWYDPTVAATDELLGKRQHEKSKEEKAPRKNWPYW